MATVVAVLALAAIAPDRGTASDEEPAPAPGPRIEIEGGKLTVDLRDADLAEVLQRIAARAGFRVEATGDLGRVTVAFADLPLERGIRRLVSPHDLMLIYPPAGRADAARGVIAIHVFAAPPAPARDQTIGTLTEINTLVRAPGDPRSLARLQELLASASDPLVRARAAWALGRIGGAAAEAALAQALGDDAIGVRLQALYAVRRLEDARAIPSLEAVLMHDPDVRMRRAAARLLGAMPAAAATSALTAGMADPNPVVREAVAQALQHRGVAPP